MLKLFRRALLLAVCLATSVQSFQIHTISRNRAHLSEPLGAKRQSNHPEYAVEDDDHLVSSSGEENATSEVRLTSPPPNPVLDEAIVEPTKTTTATATTVNTVAQDGLAKQNLQYVALPPGTVVQIQVGDMGLARKAWKKRRRSGSPLLVPCSVLNVDRASTVRWNLIYLLEKFGQSLGGKNGIQLSLADLAKRYRSHLKTSLAKQATALDFADPKALVKSLFNERVQKSYGIDMVEEENGELVLQAPVSRLRAQKRADRSPVLQIVENDDDSSSNDNNTLKHTGVVRTRREDKSEDKTNMYKLMPLSAALRMNQKEDLDPGSIQTGSMHTAVVFDYDVAGDAGSPLLTLTLNAGPRERLRFGSDQNRQNTIRNPKYMFQDLKIGDGPIKGKVVKFIKKGALIDCSIGRSVSSRSESDTVRVFGLLKFNEAVVEEESTGAARQLKLPKTQGEDWDEILSFDDIDIDQETDDDDDELDETDLGSDADLASLFDFEYDDEDGEVEDITHLITTESDGSLTYKDPDTGEVQHISMDSLDDDDEDDEDDNEELVDVFGRLEADDEEDDEEDDGPIVFSNTPEKGFTSSVSSKMSRPQRLYLGDEVEVFVRSVAKQSNQLFFTMKSSIKGKKPKVIKQESGKEKKLNRLLKQVGGMGRIQELHGRQMDGIVKATSHSGDWLYVEPQELDLPVGIAVSEDGSLDGLTKGDSVKIQLQGIDEIRGQLSMKVLDKLSP